MRDLIKTQIILLGSILLLASCNTPTTEKRKKEEKATFKVKVDISAGELFPPFDLKSVPTFFNVGQFSTKQSPKQIILLGERYSKGNEIAFEPIGIVDFKKDTLDMSYIIGVPTNIDKSNKNESSFVYNYHLQSTLEEWFKTQGDFNECRNFNWSNAYKALLELD